MNIVDNLLGRKGPERETEKRKPLPWYSALQRPVSNRALRRVKHRDDVNRTQRFYRQQYDAARAQQHAADVAAVQAIRLYEKDSGLEPGGLIAELGLETPVRHVDVIRHLAEKHGVDLGVGVQA